MTNNKDIEKKIKESAESLKVSAPINLWDRFSTELNEENLDENIDKKIKSSAEIVTKNVPTIVWGIVNKQLNIDLVWKRIFEELERKPVFAWRKIAGIAALLLLLLSWGGYHYFTNTAGSVSKKDAKEIAQQNKSKDRNDNTIKQSDTEKAVQNKKTVIKNKVHIRKSTIETKVSKFIGSDDSNQNEIEVLGSETQYKSEAQFKGDFDVHISDVISIGSSIQDSIYRIPILKANQLPLLRQTEPILLVQHKFVKLDSNVRRTKKFSLGVTYAYNNTWILNKDTRSSFRTSSLISTSVTYTSNYGFIGNYYFNKKNAISSEIIVHSRIAQDYGLYNEGKYLRKKIELNYSKLTLAYQRNAFNTRGRYPSHLTMRAGLYFGALTNHSELYNAQITASNDNYKKFDFGVKIGLGQEVVLNRFVIGYGLNSEYGFINIFNGNDKISPDFNVTKLFTAGGYINLMYKF